MATIAYSVVYDTPAVKVIKWETLTETNADGALYYIKRKSDVSFQVVGNFGTSGRCDAEGTNIPSNETQLYAALTDPSNSAIQLTAAGIKQIIENPLAIRPNIGAGTGVDVDVYMKITRQEA
ncbi:hypothetical protein LCGC14_1141070 [marine sediment metagenome]|uniref:Uncharacterized protein n=1 Tax=marine sediment metagenome TaxID=412755 RepID=A0A0F9M320_9ZZZZ